MLVMLVISVTKCISYTAGFKLLNLHALCTIYAPAVIYIYIYYNDG